MRKLLSYVAALAAVITSLPALAQSPGNYVGGSTSVYNQTTPPADRVLVNQTISSAQTGCLAAGAVSLRTTGLSTVAVTVTGTFAATLSFAAAADNNLTFNSVFGTPQGGGTGTNAVKGPGVWMIPVTGYRGFCVYASSYTSGTATVSLEGSAAPPSTVASTGTPLGSPVPGNINQWSGQPAFLGIGPSLVPGYGASPRVAISTDSNIFGYSSRATFATTQQVTVPTSAANLFAIESPANQVVRLRYLKVCPADGALQTTAGMRTIMLFRTTAASSGGSAITTTSGVNPDPNDPPFSGIVRTGAITTTPSAPTITANGIDLGAVLIPAAVGNTLPCWERTYDLSAGKVPTSLAGTGNGLALRDTTGGAGGAGNYDIIAFWTAETPGNATVNGPTAGE